MGALDLLEDLKGGPGHRDGILSLAQSLQKAAHIE
jgi:hypothetical protein